MLKFAIEYREALESITGNQRMKLRQYELTEDWEITDECLKNSEDSPKNSLNTDKHI